ncbi:MAG: hypothetical protein K8W52_10240 [Deltaproteobacteria bacterium]|nr:hypothetical protein [Deltaproteobacteria bacterium]
MKRALFAALVAVVVLFAIKVGYADDESDRQSLIRDIDGMLRDAASSLDGAVSDSSASDIESARSKVRDVRSKVSSLERVKGDDSLANKYVSSYPRYCDDFDRASQNLVQLKNDQRSVAELPRRCQDLDKQLVEQAEQFERAKDGTRIEELRRLALDVGGKAEDWFRDADRKKDEMQRWAGEAARFSISDEQWSYVSSKLQSDTREILDAWQRDYTQADAACKDLRQRDRHPVVDRVLRNLANTAQGKDAIYAKLDEKLKRIESLVKDVVGASDPGKMDEALSTMSEIASLVTEVDSIKGTDRKATAIAEQWPEYVRSFEPAARSLRALKVSHHGLDPADDACKADAVALGEMMKAALEAHDPDGLTEVPAKARERGEHYRTALTAMDQFRSTMTGLKSTVEAFDPRDERWRNLKDVLRGSAAAIYEYWDKQAQLTHSECDDLAKGDRNPAVERFLNDLGNTTSNELATYQKEAGDWEAKARGVYILDCKDMQELWDAWCSVEFEPNEEPEDSVVEQKTAEVIERERATIADLIGDSYTTLAATGKRLQTKAKYAAAAGEVLKELEKQKRRLEKLQDKNKEWKGTNNPAVAFVTAFGKQQHDRMNGEFSCNLYDKSGFPGLSRQRPDCVVVNGKGECWIYEFKPRGVNGDDQAETYRVAVQRYYQEKMRAEADADSNLGGHEFQTLVEANCREGRDADKTKDTLLFKATTKPYDRCARRYECEQ